MTDTITEARELLTTDALVAAAEYKRVIGILLNLILEFEQTSHDSIKGWEETMDELEGVRQQLDMACLASDEGWAKFAALRKQVAEGVYGDKLKQQIYPVHANTLPIGVASRRGSSAINEREEFEAWASKEGWSESDIKDRFAIDCPRGDEYRNFGLQDFWEVWQAARKLMEEELAALRKDADSLMAMCSLLEKCRREKERLNAELADTKNKIALLADLSDFQQRTNEFIASELAAAKAKHYEECAVIAETTPHQYGVNADGQTWLAKATRNTCADAIRAALTDKPTQPLK